MLNASLVQQIYQIIKHKILDLELSSDQRIDTQQLAEEFGVSQTPIRDALNRLAADGLVKVQPRVGYYVIQAGHRDVIEIYDLRIIFESYALPAVIQNLPRAKVEKLKEKMERLQREGMNEDKKRKEFQKLDEQLHRSIIESSNNERLKNFFSQIYDFVIIFQHMDTAINAPLEEHIAFLDALLRQDLDGARSILCAHIYNARDRLLRKLQETCQETVKGLYIDPNTSLFQKLSKKSGMRNAYGKRGQGNI